MLPSRRLGVSASRRLGVSASRPSGLLDRGLHVLKGKAAVVQVFGIDRVCSTDVAVLAMREGAADALRTNTEASS